MRFYKRIDDARFPFLMIKSFLGQFRHFCINLIVSSKDGQASVNSCILKKMTIDLIDESKKVLHLISVNLLLFFMTFIDQIINDSLHTSQLILSRSANLFIIIKQKTMFSIFYYIISNTYPFPLKLSYPIIIDKQTNIIV